MASARGILIHPTRPELNIVGELSTELSTLTTAVDGYLEAAYGYRQPDHTDAEAPRVTFLFNENGKILCDEAGRPRRLPLNATATGLWWHYAPTMYGRDVLVGPVVVFGGADADGEFRPVPQDVIDTYTALITGDYAVNH